MQYMDSGPPPISTNCLRVAGRKSSLGRSLLKCKMPSVEGGETQHTDVEGSLLLVNDPLTVLLTPV